MGVERTSAGPTPAPAAPAAAPATAPAVSQPYGNAAAMEALRAGHQGGAGAAYGAQTEPGTWGELFTHFDRQNAKIELANRFDIVPDGFFGPLQPNQVTQSEFDRVATLYSDIRLGNTDLSFNSKTRDFDEFKSRAMGDIATILTTSQGRDLLDQLAYGEGGDGTHHRVSIGGVGNPENIKTDVMGGKDRAAMYDGRGAASSIFYPAGKTIDMARMDPTYENADFRHNTSDTVLFHEMLHALHIKNGTAAAGVVDEDHAVQAGDAGALTEEYETVGLSGKNALTENGYRSERALVTHTDVPHRKTYLGPDPKP